MKFEYAGDTLSRLQPGMIIIHEGRRHRVVMVNDCRARVIPLERVQREVEQIIDGKKVVVASFSAPGAAQNISPNSTCEIVGFEQPNNEPVEKPIVIKKPVSVQAVAGLPRRRAGRPRK